MKMLPLDISQSMFKFANYPSFSTRIRSLDSIFSSMPHADDVSALGSARRSLAEMENEIQSLFLDPVNLPRMLSMSSMMRRQYEAKLQSSSECMLPSYNHTLPSGQETGTYLALDVGGSTFRVALVDLNGRSCGDSAMQIERMSVSKITERVRRLPGPVFFDWMAEKIGNMLAESGDDFPPSNGAIPLGLTWSFPIEQTSARGGKIQGMGKGFCGHQETIGHDLGDLVTQACRRQNIHVRVDAIVNDSSGTLLCQAYTEPTTSMALIVGTGTNAAVYLPTSCLGPEKLGVRDQSWNTPFKKVITNTELSMFGKGILPETRWDGILNRDSPLPDFQPLEYLTTGRYLGEIFRLIIVEAVETTGLFGGVLPKSLLEPYSLDTAILANLEEDHSSTLSTSIAYLKKLFDLQIPPTKLDVSFLQTVAASIAQRAAAYLAVAIHALWRLQKEAELGTTLASVDSKTSIACNGSVILKYPGFRLRCQDYIAQLIAAESEAEPDDLHGTHEVTLEPADEAAVLGAAVAVALYNSN